MEQKTDWNKIKKERDYEIWKAFENETVCEVSFYRGAGTQTEKIIAKVVYFHNGVKTFTNLPIEELAPNLNGRTLIPIPN